MKNYSKKLIAAALSFVLVASVFTACGKPKEDEITRPDGGIAKPESTTEAILDEETSDTTTTETTTGDGATTTKSSLEGVDSLIPEMTTKKASGGKINMNAVYQFVNDMGFEYDATQGIFYSSIDCWQRSANYFGHYDTMAKYANMRYVTTKIDFRYDDIDWRIQMWKGQYGALGGAEIGVYTKIPKEHEEVYACADDDHLLNMYYDLYYDEEDYLAGKKYFYRDAWNGAGHWWLTGFKPGLVSPEKMIMDGKLHMKTNAMAGAFDTALARTGFVKVDNRSEMTYNTYYRDGRDFHFLWTTNGAYNY